MPRFEVTADGRRFEVDAPSREAALEAFQGYIQQNPTEGPWRRGILAPVERNEESGALRPAVPQLALNAWDAVRLPGDAARGEVPDLDPRVGAGNMSQETADRVSNAGAFLSPATPGSALRMTPAVSPQVARRFQTAASDAQVPLTEVNSRLRALGPNAMAMDLGVPLQQAASGIARSVGPGQQTIWNAVEGRARAAGGRVADDLRGAFGSGPPAATIADDIARQQAQASAPLYEAVRGVEIPVQGALSTVMQTPMGQQAFNRAATMAANDGVPAGGAMTIGMLDYAKRALDDIASSASRSGNNNEARQARALANALTREADALVPEYATARNTFAGFAAVSDALEQGTTLFSRSTNPMEFSRTYNQMTQSERDALLQGARSAVEEAVGYARNEPLRVRNMLDNAYNRQKLEVLLGQDEAAGLIQAIERELGYSQTRSLVNQGSVTAFGQAGQRAATPEAFQQPSQSLTQMLTRAFTNARNRSSSARRQQENAEYADLLTQGQVPPSALTPPANRLMPVSTNLTGRAVVSDDVAVRLVDQFLGRSGGGGF